MSEVRYVQRDPQTGKITGHFANPHPYAQEALDKDHPDIVDWYNKIAIFKSEYLARKVRLDPEKLLAKIEELEREIAKLKGV